ncbi:uncharacterized protein METZ01_LOCUS279454, partial [marine metagenome]
WGIPQIDETRVAKVDSEMLPPGAKDLALLKSGTKLLAIGERVVNHWGDVLTGLSEAQTGPLRITGENPETIVEIKIPASAIDRQSIAEALYLWQDNVIGVVNPGSPAEKGGLREGDRVVKIDGILVSNWYDMTDLVRSNPDVQLEFALEREGRELTRFVTPELIVEGGAELGLIGTLAPALAYSYEKVPLLSAVQLGYQETLAWSGMILTFVKDLFTGGVSSRDIGSVLAIGQIAGQTVRQGIEFYLRFVALFSINLAILNLLPIPVLDGGHLMFLGLEAIRGKPLSLGTKLVLSKIGFIFLITIMVLALYNDIARLMGM